MRYIKHLKVFESNNTNISLIEPKDNDEIINILSIVFGFIDDIDTIKSKIEKRLNNGLSIKIKFKNEIVGCYLLAEKSINTFIEQINNNDISDFKEEDTKISLDSKLSDVGLQGISLAILPKYRNMGFGKLLKNYTYNLDYDYIWGVQDKRLENINLWKKSREIFAESSTRYATIKYLKNKFG